MNIDTSQSIRIGPHYLKYGSMATFMLFVGCFIFYIALETLEAPVGWGYIGFGSFTLLCGILFSTILAGTTYIELTPLGTTIVQLGHKKQLQWDEVTHFSHEIHTHVSFITYHYSEVYFQRYPEKGRKRYCGGFVNHYRIRLFKLEDTLNAYRERHAPREFEGE